MRVLSPLRIAILLAVVLAAPSLAAARTTVYHLSAKQLPRSLDDAPEKLTKAIAELVEGTIVDGTAAAAASLLGCTTDDATCLDQLARKHRADEIVFGTIRSDGKRVLVKLTRFIVGVERREKTFALTPPSALGKQLVRAARVMFDLEPGDGERAEEPAGNPLLEDEPRPRARLGGVATMPRIEDSEEPASTTESEAASQARRRIDQYDRERERGKITPGTYAMIGGGAAGIALGTGLLIAAQSLRDDLANAPDKTPEDIARLRDLERAGRLRTQIGSVCLGVGAAVAITGVVRAVIQRRPIEDRGVAVVPAARGAALVFSGTFW